MKVRVRLAEILQESKKKSVTRVPFFPAVAKLRKQFKRKKVINSKY
jgi:hypothetical protein